MNPIELAAPRLITHNTGSFEELFRSEYPSVHRTVLRLVGENGRAEEITAEVFVKLLERPALFRSDHITAWLHRSALNAALDDLRKQRAQNDRRMISGDEGTSPTPYALLERSERARQVRSVLFTMGSRDVQLLIAKSMDLSHERMAAVTGIKKSSIGTLLTRAQSTFEKKYTRKYGSY